jgi:hypothetical protein
MRSLLVTELAKFLHLHAVGVISLVFGGCVVSLFAACTSQSDNYPHDVHLPKTSFFSEESILILVETTLFSSKLGYFCEMNKTVVPKTVTTIHS